MTIVRIPGGCAWRPPHGFIPDMTRGFFERLFSGIPKGSGPLDEERRREQAECRFFIDSVQRQDDTVRLVGLIGRGRLYVGEPCELVGFGEQAIVRCRAIWKGRAYQDFAWRQTHFDPFVVEVEHDRPETLRAGQVLAAAGTAHNVLRCTATIEVTGTPANLGRPLAHGSRATVWFRKATVDAEVNLLEGRERAVPGETVRVQFILKEALPLEVGDEIRLGTLGHIFADGRVEEVAVAV